MTGRLTALIGGSSGKTSAAHELQLLLKDPHLIVGLDHFFSMFPHHWAGHPRGPGPGLWYDDSIDPDGLPRARIHYGEAGQRLLTGMRGAVRTLLDAGNDVILDEMPIDDTILPAWRSDLRGHESFWVLLTAPWPVVEERERQRRTGQHLGNARGHDHHLDKAGEFDLRLDTSATSPRDTAIAIRDRRPFLRTL